MVRSRPGGGPHGRDPNPLDSSENTGSGREVSEDRVDLLTTSRSRSVESSSLRLFDALGT